MDTFTRFRRLNPHLHHFSSFVAAIMPEPWVDLVKFLVVKLVNTVLARSVGGLESRHGFEDLLKAVLEILFRRRLGCLVRNLFEQSTVRHSRRVNGKMMADFALRFLLKAHARSD